MMAEPSGACFGAHETGRIVKQERGMMAEPLGCHDCGLRYGGEAWVEAVIPDAAWCRISPTGDLGGILCISCMARRLRVRGLTDVPVWLCGTEPLKAQTGDPSTAEKAGYYGGYRDPDHRGRLVPIATANDVLGILKDAVDSDGGWG